MSVTTRNIIRHELIGLQARVVESTDKNKIGIEGRVIDETMQTLKIRKQNGKEVVVPKKECVFMFMLPSGEKVQVNGKLLYGRPADRIKKRLPKRVWGEI
jgi:ribonuclease P protein subunit POP4